MSENVSKHVFFFDVRNTLGVVDRAGHLVPFRPSTKDLLDEIKKLEGASLAIITNVPAGIDAVKMLADADLSKYFEHIISTQDPEFLSSNVSKPQRTMYELAAKKVGVSPSDCTYVSENLLEVLGAINAGMNGVTKRFPPGGDYMRHSLPKGEVGPISSGRATEAILEGQHLVGKRIVIAAEKISKRIRGGDDFSTQNSSLTKSMSRLVWLVNNFVDPYHHRMEEEVLIPFAQIHGYSSSKIRWVQDEHDQGRAYFHALKIALTRVLDGNKSAAKEFAALTEAFVLLYKEHGQKEDDELFKEIGDSLTDEDDALMCGMLERLGPPDITLHYDMIQAMEMEAEG